VSLRALLNPSAGSPRHARDRQDMAHDRLQDEAISLVPCHCEPSLTLRQAPLGMLGTGRTWLRTGSRTKQSPLYRVIASPERAKQSPLLHAMGLVKARCDPINQKFALSPYGLLAMTD
jgi:hypothetical protein